MTTYYLIATSSRSPNSIQDGSDEIKTYYLTMDNPADDAKFNCWVDTSESLIHQFETGSNEQAIILFNTYMEKNYDTSNSLKSDDDHSDIVAMTLGKPAVDSHLFSIADPDDFQEDGQSFYPEPNDNVEYLYNVDSGCCKYIDDCLFFDEFLEIPEFLEFINYMDEDISNIDWSDIEPSSYEMNEIIKILEKNGFITETALSPGHLDSSSPAGEGEGSVYSYVFIKKEK